MGIPVRVWKISKSVNGLRNCRTNFWRANFQNIKNVKTNKQSLSRNIIKVPIKDILISSMVWTILLIDKLRGKSFSSPNIFLENCTELWKYSIHQTNGQVGDTRFPCFLKAKLRSKNSSICLLAQHFEDWDKRIMSSCLEKSF